MENNNEKQYWGSKFYGSKLNTILLLVLIILMIFALRIINKDKDTYLPIANENVSTEQNISDDREEKKLDTANWKKVIIENEIFFYPPNYTLINKVDSGCQTINCMASEAQKGNLALKLIPETGNTEDIIFIGSNSEVTSVECHSLYTYCYVVFQGSDQPGLILWTESRNPNIIAIAKNIILKHNAGDE